MFYQSTWPQIVAHFYSFQSSCWWALAHYRHTLWLGIFNLSASIFNCDITVLEHSAIFALNVPSGYITVEYSYDPWNYRMSVPKLWHAREDHIWPSYIVLFVWVSRPKYIQHRFYRRTLISALDALANVIIVLFITNWYVQMYVYNMSVVLSLML